MRVARCIPPDKIDWTNAPAKFTFAQATLQGAETELISTAGDADRWEVKLLMSKPNSSAQILALLRARVGTDSGVGGMNNHISHVRSGPTFIKGGKESELKWKFTDEQGRNWNGLGIVEPAPDSKDKFIVVLKLARQSLS
jgi:hypothetical protein